MDNKPTTLFKIFGNFTKFQYNFHSPQVLQNLKSCIKSLYMCYLTSYQTTSGFGFQEIMIYYNNPKTAQRHNFMSSVSSEINFALSTQKICKNRYQRFSHCLTLLDLLIFLKIFCTGLSVETNAYLKIALVPFKFLSFDIFGDFEKN